MSRILRYLQLSLQVISSQAHLFCAGLRTEPRIQLTNSSSKIPETPPSPASLGLIQPLSHGKILSWMQPTAVCTRPEQKSTSTIFEYGSSHDSFAQRVGFVIYLSGQQQQQQQQLYSLRSSYPLRVRRRAGRFAFAANL